jgi:hypothetical protein
MLVSRLNTSHNRRPHKKAATVKYSGDFVISPGEKNGESAIAPMISLLRASYKENETPFIAIFFLFAQYLKFAQN